MLEHISYHPEKYNEAIKLTVITKNSDVYYDSGYGGFGRKTKIMSKE